jgi:hypothetical protein
VGISYFFDTIIDINIPRLLLRLWLRLRLRLAVVPNRLILRPSIKD